jgi:predicted ATPase/DNA-binding SARP family transcriptional activator
MHWRVELLGKLRLADEERAVTPFLTQKVGALLAYLAYYRHQSHPREMLIELLWPEIDAEAGRHNLRSLLHLLRRQTQAAGTDSSSLVVVSRGAVQLHPSVTTDVAEFMGPIEAAARAEKPEVRAEQLATAVSLYRGELLPGAYESWVLAERQRLAELCLQALQQLARALEQSGDLEGAVEAAQRAVSADPLREEAHYELMRLYAAAGRPSATVKQYHELERLLREELGEGPSAATQALVAELRETARDSMRSRSLATPAHPRPAEDEDVERRAPPRALGPGSDEEQADTSREPARRSGPAEPGVATPPPLPLREGPDRRLPDAPPPPVPSPARLPMQFTRFFGREEEIASLTAALPVPETRLVTLTGPGGSGKTRLAIAVAGRLQEEFAGAVWFVPLAEVAEARRIGDAIRDAMRLPASTDGEPLEQVAAALSPEPSLLVLDNFEQLVGEGALTVRYLLERVPRLTCVVTSRHRLNLAAEQEFPVRPLPVPGVQAFRRSGVGDSEAPGADLNARTPERLNALLAYPSVQLFVDRARAVRPDFQVTERNAAALAELCMRLEGLPLAIELAAARAQVLSPQQMLGQLQRRFDLLVSRQQDMAPRHRSLRAAIEWSYHLLPPDVRQFFTRLSIFRGGWTLEAAEAVCGEGVRCWVLGVGSDAEPPTPDPQHLTPNTQHLTHVLDCMVHLREASIVLAEEVGTGMRYRLLETLREFAAEQLSPEEHATLARRHLQYVEWIAGGERYHGGGPWQSQEDVKQWLRELDADYDNLRSALDWALQAEPRLALNLADKLANFWNIRGYWTEALEFLPRAAAFVSDDTWQSRARALRNAGTIATSLGEFERARAFLEEVILLGRENQHTEFIGAALGNQGDNALAQGDFDRARRLFQESIEIRVSGGHPNGTCWPLAGLGHVAQAQGDYETARAYYEQSLAIHRRRDGQRQIAERLQDLGSVAYWQGDYEAARRLFAESLTILQEFGEKTGIGLALKGLGDVALESETSAEARSYYRQSLSTFRELGHRQGITGTLEGLARLAQVEGRLSQAARLYAAAQGLRDALSAPLAPNEQPRHQEWLAALRQSLGEAAFDAAWEAGHALPWEQAVAEALMT